MSLADLLEVSVTVRTKTWSNVRGVRTASDTDATLDASVQEMAASRAARHGIDGGVAAFTVYFDADAFRDAIPGGVKTGDVILWGDRRLGVLARHRDEGGAGEVFSVDCSEFA